MDVRTPAADLGAAELAQRFANLSGKQKIVVRMLARGGSIALILKEHPERFSSAGDVQRTALGAAEALGISTTRGILGVLSELGHVYATAQNALDPVGDNRNAEEPSAPDQSSSELPPGRPESIVQKSLEVLCDKPPGTRRPTPNPVPEPQAATQPVDTVRVVPRKPKRKKRPAERRPAGFTRGEWNKYLRGRPW